MQEVHNLSIPGLPSVSCLWAETAWERGKGLLGRTGLPCGTVMGFHRCRAVHTVGMKFPIDIIFTDRAGKIVKICRNVPSGRLCVWGGFRAATTYEAQAGWILSSPDKNSLP